MINNIYLIDPKLDLQYKKLPAIEAHYNNLICETNANIYLDNVLFAVIRNFETNLRFDNIKFTTAVRLSGLETSSVNFGWSPEVRLKNLPVRHHTQAKYLRKHYDVLNEVAGLSSSIENIYKESMPENFDNHKKLSDEISSEFKLAQDGIYTSGVINNTNALLYHKDKSNFTESCSAMIYKEYGKVSGGHLVLPNLNVGIKFQNNSLIIFNGAKHLHGVTNIKLGANSKRITAVYYTTEEFKNYKSYKEAISSFQKYQMDKALKSFS